MNAHLMQDSELFREPARLGNLIVRDIDPDDGGAATGKRARQNPRAGAEIQYALSRRADTQRLQHRIERWWITLPVSRVFLRGAALVEFATAIIVVVLHTPPVN